MADEQDITQAEAARIAEGLAAEEDEQAGRRGRPGRAHPRRPGVRGSTHPFNQPEGRPMHLRGALYRRPCSTAQRKALAAGRPVVFETKWLASHFSPGSHPDLPEDLGAAPAWRVEGDYTLVPV
jgi:hypothetical protein